MAVTPAGDTALHLAVQGGRVAAIQVGATLCCAVLCQVVPWCAVLHFKSPLWASLLSSGVCCGCMWRPCSCSIAGEVSNRATSELHLAGCLRLTSRLKPCATCPAPQVLVAEGVSCDRRNSKGDAPLHAAAARGQVAAVLALLAGGASLDLRNRAEDTPLVGWRASEQAGRAASGTQFTGDQGQPQS